jgi:hypothetical protein
MAEQHYAVGQVVYWSQHAVVWSGTVVNCGEEIVAVWTTAGMMRFLPLAEVRVSP